MKHLLLIGMLLGSLNALQASKTLEEELAEANERIRTKHALKSVKKRIAEEKKAMKKKIDREYKIKALDAELNFTAEQKK